MQSFKRTQSIFVGLFILYSLMAAGEISFLIFSRKHVEIFPFFSWALFAVVPNSQTDYWIEVTELDNEHLSDPLLLHHEKVSLASQGKTNPIYLSRLLGKAVEQGDADKTERAVIFIKKAFFSKHRQAAFQLVRVVYRPLHFIKTGEWIDREVLALYTYEEAQ